MGERLYGDPTLTIRELLQNSIDAVRYRESMERKEGNPFPPFIKITLKNNELIIEDNGIGMDEYIFENYFLQIGKSYYNSSECRTRGVEIDPVSEFGIGILSTFMVASSFRVESRRKTLDPLNPPAPINVEIPTAYDYFVRRPSSRVDIGTKITLFLKSNHPFSSISLVEKISEIAPFIEYPIVIETSEKTVTYKPYLPGEKIYNANNLNEYFEVTFDNEKESIDGKMLVCKSRFALSNYSVFAQRGFSIPCNKLLPSSLFDDIQASINLSGQYKISLSPNRSDIVEDEKYKKLIDKIQYKFLEAFETYLKMLRDSSPFEEYLKHINELLEYNILSLHKGSPSQGFNYQVEKFENAIKDLFLTYAPLLTISDDGQRVYKTMKNLSATSLAITDINDWPEKIPDAIILKETKRLVGLETILLMHEEEGMWRRNNFFEHILGNFSGIYITSIPGVVIKTFYPFYHDRTSKNAFPLSHDNFTCQIHNDSKEKAPLFVHPPDFYDYEPADVIYNANHPLFAKLLDGKKPKNEKTSKAIDMLTHYIGNCLSHLSDKAYLSFSKRSQGLKESANFNYMLIGILKYYPEIFQEFYEAIEQYWEEAKDLGVISHDEDFIGFSLDDLPWFWNCELSDFNFE